MRKSRKQYLGGKLGDEQKEVLKMKYSGQPTPTYVETMGTKRVIKRKRRTRKHKQKGRGNGDSMPTRFVEEPIVTEDILFQDADVCILKPHVKKGVLIFTNYSQPEGKSLCEIGLKSGAQLQREGIDFGRSMIHDYIFFRAPYVSNVSHYESIDTEIESLFGEGANTTGKVWIRIDPSNTYVYSSEIRAKFFPPFMFNSSEYLTALEREVRKSRKSMNDYLRILGENELLEVQPDKKVLYNLFSSKAVLFGKMAFPPYPYDSLNINRQSEVLVRVPHLPPSSFVLCS